MTAFTAKSYQLGKAPRKITLLGDKSKPEPAQHIIEFPGGAVEVSRLSDGSYWAHLIVNTGWASDDQEGLHGARGYVAESRYAHAGGVEDFPVREGVQQVAVLIRREDV